MLFPMRLHDGIRAGEVTVAFRRWKRPTVAQGGTLQTAAGLLRIDELVSIAEADIGPDDARLAGFGSVEEVLGSLRGDGARTLYRIRFVRVGDDPRLARRADTDLDETDVADVDDQLARWDAASRTGPWTARLLELISTRPGEPSRRLAEEAGTDQPRLKRRVRQLKGLGLTESLETGYRLSPRGVTYLRRNRAARPLDADELG